MHNLHGLVKFDLLKHMLNKDDVDEIITMISTRIHNQLIKSMKDVKQFKNISKLIISNISNFSLNYTISLQ